jgi:ABC-type branched-subunit amino acid transport system substrate-binding protein
LRGCTAAIAVLAAALGLLLPGCGEEESSAGATLTVHVSLPRSGEQAADSRAVIAGLRAALEEADGRGGDQRVRIRIRDNTGGGPGADPVAVAENARRATEDSTTIAYVGDLGLGPTRTSLPITNAAEFLQVDPGVGGSFLSRPIPDRPDPDRYRPSGELTFVPLTPANNDIQFCGDFEDLGYEAMRLIIDAIETAGADREGVIDAVLATRDRESRIGTYSINGNGEVIAEPLPGCFP